MDTLNLQVTSKMFQDTHEINLNGLAARSSHPNTTRISHKNSESDGKYRQYITGILNQWAFISISNTVLTTDSKHLI